ncbi:hypothetical protein EJ05DRAFT_151586 [Pseudovirgaria hyperparasitica]|uniref:Uncharacterized protein n=1 Tax=Pseudovirgaria hyperparasitica TaxID=470096 RepID=A0A6A6VVC8_9PEZI|nr:uncharacterized protein EJ05DRAFT_151586 [Pseudovirgaria hyperparasitica]KAF2754183.1 hypothetical protein EJ05DRAFT_151586 [Pseudovirgaria hyperparasitica]
MGYDEGKEVAAPSEPELYTPDRTSPEAYTPATTSRIAYSADDYADSESQYVPTPLHATSAHTMSPTSSEATAAPGAPRRTKFALMTLHMHDRLRLLDFPPGETSLVRDTILYHWPPGLNVQRMHEGSMEFGLHGTPWIAPGKNSITVRRMMRAVLAALYDRGWILDTAVNVGRQPQDKDSLIFAYRPQAARVEWMSVAFSCNDRVRIIDGPSDFVKGVTYAMSVLGLRSQGLYKEDARVYELRFKGLPWLAVGLDQGVMAQTILLRLMSELNVGGWSVYASINQKQGANGFAKSDTWHCSRPIGWVTNPPAYQV